MTVLATLDGARLELVLRVEGDEFPQFDSGWDANWLVCDVELDVGLLGSFHAHDRLPSRLLSSSASGISCEFSPRSSPGRRRSDTRRSRSV